MQTRAQLAELQGELRSNSIIAEVSNWKEDIRDWRKLSCEATARQWKELQESPPPPKTPRLYSTHLRLPVAAIQRRQLCVEGLLNAIAVGNLQACEEGYFWAPGFAPGAVEHPLRAPLSHASMPTMRPKSSPAQIEAVHDQDVLQLCRSAAQSGQRTALVHFAPAGEEQALPMRELRESQLYLRTTYLYALSTLPRQMHKDASKALQDGCIIHTAHVSILRGDVAEGAPWLEPTEIEVLTVALQRRPYADHHEQYGRIREKAAVAKTIDDIFASAAEFGIEVLVFPPLGINGSFGCYHPPSDAGQLLRHAALSGGDVKVLVAKQHSGPLGGWASFADAVVNGRAPLKREPPIPMHLSPYFNCYLGPLPSQTTI
ncbi:unnamed protein product [Durusdinium trenchii]|uniref:CN hydrolase domain-containing protein n=1 Tax=Durusdinium trenchii TaxID=1381693 RepID=A0ABP0MIW0_9DINO